RLFRNSIFAVGNGFGFLAGMAMFGAIIFLPLYLQAVKGFSPTKSGLSLLPVVVGLFTTAIISGRLISRTGRYRIYPIIGAVVLTVAMWLLSRLHVASPYWVVAGSGFLFGCGLGFTMQTIMVAVQNSVHFRDMGTATSVVTFSRSMGGAIGTAVFGAVLYNRLAFHLRAAFAGSTVAGRPLPSGNATRNIKAM